MAEHSVPRLLGALLARSLRADTREVSEVSPPSPQCLETTDDGCSLPLPTRKAVTSSSGGSGGGGRTVSTMTAPALPHQTSACRFSTEWEAQGWYRGWTPGRGWVTGHRPRRVQSRAEPGTEPRLPPAPCEPIFSSPWPTGTTHPRHQRAVCNGKSHRVHLVCSAQQRHHSPKLKLISVQAGPGRVPGWVVWSERGSPPAPGSSLTAPTMAEEGAAGPPAPAAPTSPDSNLLRLKVTVNEAHRRNWRLQAELSWVGATRVLTSLF